MHVSLICNRVLRGEPSPQPMSRRCVHVFRICNGVLRGESGRPRASSMWFRTFDDTQMMSNLCSQGSQGPGDQGSRVVHLPAARSAHIFRFLPPTQCSQDFKSLFRCLAFLFGHFGKWKPWHSPIPMVQRELFSAPAAAQWISLTLRHLSLRTRLLHVCERGAGETVAHRSLWQANHFPVGSTRPPGVQPHHGAILNPLVAFFIATITTLGTKKVATSDKPKLLCPLTT